MVLPPTLDIVEDNHLGLASGRASARVPWKQIGDNNHAFIAAELCPPGFLLREPSDMNKAAVEAFLAFWRERQEKESGLYTFRFQRYLKGQSVHDIAPALYHCQVPQMNPTNPILASPAAPSHVTADPTQGSFQRNAPFTSYNGDCNMTGPSRPSIGWGTVETGADMNDNSTFLFGEGPGWLDPTIFPQFDNFLENCNNNRSDVFNSLTMPTAEPFLPQDVPQGRVAQPATDTRAAAQPPQPRPKPKPVKSAAHRAAFSTDVAPSLNLEQRPKPKPIHSAAQRAAASSANGAMCEFNPPGLPTTHTAVISKSKGNAGKKQPCGTAGAPVQLTAAAKDAPPAAGLIVSAGEQVQMTAAGLIVSAETQLSDNDGQSVNSGGLSPKRTRRPKRHFEFSAKDGIQPKKKKRTK